MASQHYQRALEINRRVHGAESYQVAKVLDRLAFVRLEQGSQEPALEYLTRSFDILTGLSHVDLQDWSGKVALQLTSSQNFELALGYYLHVERALEKLHGKNSLPTILVSAARAKVQTLQSESEIRQSIALQNQTLTLLLEHHPNQHLEISNLLSALAFNHLKLLEPEKAKPLL